MFAFISDISDPEMVGFRLGMVQVVALLGVPVGAMLGGLSMKPVRKTYCFP